MKFWYMQLHPGDDPKGYHAERMRNVVLKWNDVGMGDGSQWRDGGATRRRFRETMQNGDVVALAHGKRFIALVKVVGEYERNLSDDEDHWYGVRRKVQVLCDDPVPYLVSYVNAAKKAPAEGLPIRVTLAQIRKNEFVEYWYDKVMAGDADLPLSENHEKAPKRKSTLTSAWERDPQIVEIVRSRGRCEVCGKTKTFERPDGRQYMEAHHLISLARQGSFSCSLDVLANVACLCPECHRFLHFGAERAVRAALVKLYRHRENDLKKAGLAKSLNGFVGSAKDTL